MNEKEKRIFFAIIKSAVLGVALSENEKADFSYEMLPKFYILSKKHTISHLIAVGLETNGLIIKENEFCEKFQKQKFSAFFRQEKINHQFDKQCAVLEKEGIPFIALKGSVIKELYPESWMRTSSDIDILVMKKDLKKAESVLKDKLSYSGEKKGHYHNISLFSEDGVHLELHFSIKEAMANIDSLLQNVWDYAEKKQGKNYEYVLTNEFFIFHIIAHSYYHFMTGGCGIKSIIDLMLLKEKMSFDEAKLITMCRQCKIEKFYIALVDLLNVWFNGNTYTEFISFMENFIFDGGVFGNLSNNVKVKRAKGGRLNYFLDKIFLPTHLMLSLFPILEKHVWLLPFCHFYRIFTKVLFQNGFKKVKNEIKRNKNLSKDEMQKTADFLQQLED